MIMQKLDELEKMLADAVATEKREAELRADRFRALKQQIAVARAALLKRGIEDVLIAKLDSASDLDGVS